jgi:hypothetical protein
LRNWIDTKNSYKFCPTLKVLWKIAPIPKWQNIHTYIPLTLYPQRGSRNISYFIPPRHFTKMSKKSPVQSKLTIDLCQLHYIVLLRMYCKPPKNIRSVLRDRQILWYLMGGRGWQWVFHGPPLPFVSASANYIRIFKGICYCKTLYFAKSWDFAVKPKFHQFYFK